MNNLQSKNQYSENMNVVNDFLNKYENGNEIIQTLRKDLMTIASDIHWIIESNNQNEQFALDFADALNSISTII